MTQSHGNGGVRRARLNGGGAALWASAFVILAMIIVQAGRHGGAGLEREAKAGDVSQIGDMTILTADSGDNADILAILDRRGERLFIYGVVNSRSVELLQNYELARMFVDARESAGLRRP